MGINGVFLMMDNRGFISLNRSFGFEGGRQHTLEPNFMRHPCSTMKAREKIPGNVLCCCCRSRFLI